VGAATISLSNPNKKQLFLGHQGDDDVTEAAIWMYRGTIRAYMNLLTRIVWLGFGNLDYCMQALLLGKSNALLLHLDAMLRLGALHPSSFIFAIAGT
jgi:hypothetical protein